jgi:hypothetical protein
VIQWLPLIVAMPFTESLSDTDKKMSQNAYRYLLSRMKDDGFVGK